MVDSTDLKNSFKNERQADRTAAEIRHDIEVTRQNISETVDRLGNRINQTFNWREQVVRHPLASLGVAFGVGLVVSAIFTPKPPVTTRIMDRLAETVDDLTGTVRSGVRRAVARAIGPEIVTGALSAVAAKAAAEFIKSRAEDSLGSRPMHYPGDTTTTH